MPSDPRAGDPSSAAIGRLVAALLAGDDDVPDVDETTARRVRAVVDRLRAAREDLPPVREDHRP